MESENCAYSLDFVIGESQSSVVKKVEERINYLFNVKTELAAVFGGSSELRQWVKVSGTEDEVKKAKEYIIALTSPAERIHLKNIGNHPLFTSQVKDEIERSSCAALSKCEDGHLAIHGTEFSIMVAQSMIDDMFSKAGVITNKETSREGSRSKDPDPREDLCCTDQDFSGRETDRDESRGNASLNKNNSSLTSVIPQPTSTSLGAAAHYTDGFLTADLPLSAQKNKRTTTDQQSVQRKQFPHEIISNSSYASASAIYPRNSDTQMIESTGPYFYSNAGASQAKNVPHKVTHAGDGALASTCSYFPTNLHQAGPSGENPAEGCNSIPRLGSKSLSVQANDQQLYLRHLGQSLHYSNEDIEKGLSFYNMDDIVVPCEFLETLNEIKAQRHGWGQDNIGKDFRELPSISQRPESLAVSSVTVAKTAASADAPVQDFCVTVSDNGFRTVANAGAKAAATTHEDSSKISEQDYCGLDESVIFMGADNNTIVLSSDDEDDITEPMLVFPVPPDYPPPKHNHPVPIPSELRPTGRREPALCLDRDVAMNRDSVMEEDDCESPQRPTGPRILRYIIIDGSNVAMAHGDNKVFSVKGLRICINYFVKRGHDRITAFVPEWRRYSENQTSITGRALLEKLHNEGFLKFTPARRINGKTIASYDDRFILNLAEKEDGVIVSNDQFRDLCKERASYQDIVANRLLQFMFVQDHFMPPDDPLGRHGPHLDDFLRYPQPNLNNGSNWGEWTMVNQRQPNQRQQPSRNNFDNKNNQPERNAIVTSQLFHQLSQMFPEPEQVPKITEVLKNHKCETDLNRLSNYCMSALFI